MRTVAFFARLASEAGKLIRESRLLSELVAAGVLFGFFSKNYRSKNPVGGAYQSHTQQNFQITDFAPQ